MLLKNKLLISVGTFGLVSTAGGFVYYSTKNSNNQESLVKNSGSEGISTKPVQKPQTNAQKILEDKCAEHAKTNPRLPDASYFVD